MRDNLVGCSGSETNTYNGFVQKCVDVSNDMELYGQWTKKRGAGNSYTARHTCVPTLITTSNVNVAAHINYKDIIE